MVVVPLINQYQLHDAHVLPYILKEFMRGYQTSSMSTTYHIVEFGILYVCFHCFGRNIKSAASDITIAYSNLPLLHTEIAVICY